MKLASTLKLALAGLWLIATTAAASYAGARLAGAAQDGQVETGDAEGQETLMTDLIAVPILHDGTVKGYVVFRLNFLADRAQLEAIGLDPKPFLTDAAFRIIYRHTESALSNQQSGELDQLKKDIEEEANRQLKTQVVSNVLIQELHFINRNDIRRNWIKPE